ncbi:MAG: hypothetical protein Q7R57_00900 [Dehalococcoidales bacterium]|nr:hypothetical protein [Dehalococcoidales bacterium]
MKRPLVIALVTVLFIASVVFPGCNRISDITLTPVPARPKIVREAPLAGKWEMRHINLDVSAGEELPVLLKLADGDKVDGFFYLENGSNIDFRIMANSQVYKPQTTEASAGKGITSDRFSFTASQSQGQSYTLFFRNMAVGSDKAKVTVFLEIIYPNTGSLFTLLETK